MGTGTYRPVYDDNAFVLGRDITSTWATLAGTTVTASNFCSIAGAQSYSIQVLNALSGAAGGKVGTLTVEVNNANPVDRANATGLKWSVNPLLGQQQADARNQQQYLNTSFTGNWAKIGVFDTSVASITAFTIPARYIRLNGLGLTAGTIVAYVWTDGMSQGN